MVDVCGVQQCLLQEHTRYAGYMQLCGWVYVSLMHLLFGGFLCHQGIQQIVIKEHTILTSVGGSPRLKKVKTPNFYHSKCEASTHYI